MKIQSVKKLFKKKCIAVSLCAAMTASLLSGCAKTDSEEAAAQEEEEQQEAEDQEALKEAVNESAGIHTATPSGEMEKDETVYVIADANGNTNEVIVSDWLKNPKSDDSITDESGLSDIKNTSGDAVYTAGENDEITWSADGNDIHYQGTSDKELPVDVKITYYLNDEEIAPKDLAGKMGNVKIRFDYTNNEKTTIDVNGKEEEVYVPFAMVSGMILDSTKFSDIEVTNGRVVTEGTRNIVVGMAFPGLSESLDVEGLKEKANDITSSDKIDDFEIPEYVEVSAYTTGFEMSQTMTVAVTDILSALDSTTEQINTDSVKDSMNELQDATDQLSDGTVALSDGAKELMDGAKTLSEKSVELDDGAKQLDDGATDLDNGASDLQEGAKKLDDGTATLVNGTVSLKDGTKQLVDGVNTLKSGTGDLKDGTAELKEAFEGTSGAVYGAQKLTSGANQLQAAFEGDEGAVAGAKQLASGAETLKEGFEGDNGAVAGAKALAEGSYKLNEAVKSISVPSLTDEEKAVIQQEGAAGAQEYTEQFVKSIAEGDGTAKNPGVVAAVASGAVTAITEEIDPDAIGSEAAGKIDDAIDAGSGSVYQVYAALVNAGFSEDQAKGALESIASTAASTTATDIKSKIAASTSAIVAAAIPTVEESLQTKLNDGLGELGAGIALNTAETIMDKVAETLTTQMATLQAATQQLSDGNASLYDGVNQLYAGATKLSDGNASLSSGIDQLYDGTKQLAEGNNSLQTGIIQLYYGATQLDDGAAQLNDGVGTLQDGAYSLDNGACSLRDGAVQLKDGTSELYNGTITLKNGTVDLKSGTTQLADGTSQFVDGTSQLYDGTKQLSDGTVQLLDGILQFDEEGISQLTDLFGEDVDDVIARLEGVIDAGSTYKIYTEVPDGVDSSVKFIYSTEAIKAED